MPIDLEYEISEMTPDLQMAEGYLECEQIIINNIRKHVKKGLEDNSIIEFLHKLSGYYKDRINETQNTTDCTNFRYVEGFVNTLIKMPYWRSWIQTINMG